jgi:pyruvate,orthophosphate dikinase
MMASLPAANDSDVGDTATRFVYRFGGGVSDGGSGDRNLLGGKGANLAEMASIGLPVPPGFTISTTMCAVYYAAVPSRTA